MISRAEALRRFMEQTGMTYEGVNRDGITMEPRPGNRRQIQGALVPHQTPGRACKHKGALPLIEQEAA